MKALITIFFSMLMLAADGLGAAPLMYVPTGQANEVLAIDLYNDRVAQRIDGLENAHGLAGNGRSRYLVAGSLRTADAAPGHAAHHGKDTEAEAATSYVTLIDRRRGQVARRIAVPAMTHHTAVSADGEYAAAVHPDSGEVSIIDLTRLTVLKTLHIGGRPGYAVFSHHGQRLYIADAAEGAIDVIATRDWRLLGEIDVGGEPGHLALSRDDKYLYVVSTADGKVREVDLPGAAVRNIYAVGASPHAVAVSADRRWLYVTVTGADKLVRIDQRSGARRSIALAPAPYHVENAEIVDKLYVSSRTQPKLWVLDPLALELLGEIDLTRGIAHQMVVIDE